MEYAVEYAETYAGAYTKPRTGIRRTEELDVWTSELELWRVYINLALSSMPCHPLPPRCIVAPAWCQVCHYPTLVYTSEQLRAREAEKPQ